MELKKDILRIPPLPSPNPTTTTTTAPPHLTPIPTHPNPTHPNPNPPTHTPMQAVSNVIKC